METTDIGLTPRKNAAVTFLCLIVAGNIREAYANYVAPGMRHHNVFFAGDAASLMQAMEEDYAANPHKTLDIKLLHEEGDLVAVLSHIRTHPEDAGYATVHTFRLSGDRIIEMWDIVQPVPANSPNENGIF